MPKRRPPDWRRGRPRYTDTRPIQERVSDTRAADPFSSRTVESTLNTAPLNPDDFKSIQAFGQQRRFWRNISNSNITTIIAVGLPLLAAIVYIVRLEGQIAVVNSEVRATQKAQDTWIGEFREQVRKLERSIEMLWTRQPAPSTSQKPAERGGSTSEGSR
jgi:hypothetical protein